MALRAFPTRVFDAVVSGFKTRVILAYLGVAVLVGFFATVVLRVMQDLFMVAAVVSLGGFAELPPLIDRLSLLSAVAVSAFAIALVVYATVLSFATAVHNGIESARGRYDHIRMAPVSYRRTAYALATVLFIALVSAAIFSLLMYAVGSMAPEFAESSNFSAITMLIVAAIAGYLMLFIAPILADADVRIRSFREWIRSYSARRREAGILGALGTVFVIALVVFFGTMLINFIRPAEPLMFEIDAKIRVTLAVFGVLFIAHWLGFSYADLCSRRDQEDFGQQYAGVARPPRRSLRRPSRRPVRRTERTVEFEAAAPQESRPSRRPVKKKRVAVKKK